MPDITHLPESIYTFFAVRGSAPCRAVYPRSAWGHRNIFATASQVVDDRLFRSWRSPRRRRRIPHSWTADLDRRRPARHSPHKRGHVAFISTRRQDGAAARVVEPARAARWSSWRRRPSWPEDTGCPGCRSITHGLIGCAGTPPTTARRSISCAGYEEQRNMPSFVTRVARHLHGVRNSDTGTARGLARYHRHRAVRSSSAVGAEPGRLSTIEASSEIRIHNIITPAMDWPRQPWRWRYGSLQAALTRPPGPRWGILRACRTNHAGRRWWPGVEGEIGSRARAFAIYYTIPTPQPRVSPDGWSARRLGLLTREYPCTGGVKDISAWAGELIPADVEGGGGPLGRCRALPAVGMTARAPADSADVVAAVRGAAAPRRAVALVREISERDRSAGTATQGAPGGTSTSKTPRQDPARAAGPVLAAAGDGRSDR